MGNYIATFFLIMIHRLIIQDIRFENPDLVFDSKGLIGNDDCVVAFKELHSDEAVELY
jgi:hypothetical protein